MKLNFLLFMVLVCTAVTIYGQQPVALPDKAGTWTYSYLDDENSKLYCRQFGMTPTEIEIFRKKLDQIVAILHQNPVMYNPRGMDPLVESRPLYPHGFTNHPENFGYIGEINFRLCTWYSSKGKEYKQTIEPPRVSVYVNSIVSLRHSAFNVAGPEGADIQKAADRVNDVCRSMKIKEFAPGVILYDYALVFAKPDKSLFLPCTVAEAYKRLIAYYELAAKKEPAFGVVLNGIKQEFSALNQSQLNSPAYFGGMFSGITPEKNDDPLYLFNNEFFGRSKPKTDVQVIVFPIDADYFRKESDFTGNDVGFKRIYQFQHSLDIDAVAGLLD